MGLSERVTAGDQRDRFFVVHRHAGKRLANVLGRRERIRLAVRPFRIHVDQAHLHGGEGVLEVALAGVALIREPLALAAPVDVFLGLPDILAAAAEPKGLEAHRLEGDVAREDHEVGPGDLAAVFLLDRPQQPARLVEVRVVRPTVERCEALLAGSRAAAAVADAVRARAVPGHPDEQRPVVAIVGRPPILRVRHQGAKVLDHGIQVEALEFPGVIERLAHRIGQGGVLVEDLEVQLVRPPVAIGPGCGSRVHDRALARALVVALFSLAHWIPLCRFMPRTLLAVCAQDGPGLAISTIDCYHVFDSYYL